MKKTNLETVLGIHFVIPKKISKMIFQIINKSAHLHSKKYILEPHLTVHLCQLNSDKYNLLIKDFSILIKNIRPITIKLKSIKEKNGWIYIDTSNTTGIKSFHQKVIKLANKYRDSLLRKKDLERLKNNKFSLQEIESLQKYGYYASGKNYSPHISLINTTPKNVQILINSFTDKLRDNCLENIITLNKIIVGLNTFDYNSNTFVDSKEKIFILK